ncbi:MAG: protein kinase [Polyangiaceae bacterium]|nr:protein kinase [Polyangiaceae bacterium]
MTGQWSPKHPEAGSATPAAPASGVMSMPRVCPTCLGRYPADFRVCPRDATPLDDAPEDLDPLLGTVLADAFQIMRLIGEGGMARVYEARHVRLPTKRFAVKVLDPAHAQNAEIVTRFQREAEAASGIGHPNVVDVYDVHRAANGQPYLICEFLDGTDFATLLQRQGKIEVTLAIAIVRQVCQALTAAHARGIVHRDVKPENVFLVGDPAMPTVKVIDFGISKMDDGTGSHLTRTGMIMGTPAYMPPEQARGGKADHRADIYGVGAILYRALTGKLPFDYDDAAEALSAVLTREPLRPRSIEASIPPALELVIQRAMSKDPAERHPSMAALAADLEPFAGEFAAVPLDPAPLDGVPVTGPVNVTAATMLSPGPTRPSPMQPTLPRVGSSLVERASREVRWARPKIVFLTLALGSFAALLLADALLSLVVGFKAEGVPLTRTEGLLVFTVVSAVALTPLVFWIRYLGRAVWGNSVRAVSVATTLGWMTSLSIIAYGVGALTFRLLGVVGVWPAAAATPIAGGALLLASLAAALLTVLVTYRRRSQ